MTVRLTNLLSTQLERILGRYGAMIIERTGTDTEQALANLAPWQDNIFLVPQTITNDVSSTKVRLFLKRGMSVRYLLPAPVVEYIETHHLYIDDTGVHAQTPETATAEIGKGKHLEVPGQPLTAPSNAVASSSGSQQE
jgi:nicotinamide mononucleotide adenylyltransferase